MYSTNKSSRNGCKYWMFSAKYHHPSQTVGTKCLILVTERVFCSLRIVSLVHFPKKFLETSVKKSPWIKEIRNILHHSIMLLFKPIRIIREIRDDEAISSWNRHFTLWQTNILRTGKSQFRIGKSTISMCHFHRCYVKLPGRVYPSHILINPIESSLNPIKSH